MSAGTSGVHHSSEVDERDPDSILKSVESAEQDEEVEHEERLDFESWRDNLTEALKTIETLVDFSAETKYSDFINPGLEIADGLIPLPLVSLVADQIKSISRPAPFGREDDTVVESSPLNMGAELR